VRSIDVRKSTFVASVFLILIVSTLSTVTAADDNASWIPFIIGAEPGSSSEVLPKSGDTTGLCVDSRVTMFFMYLPRDMSLRLVNRPFLK